MQKIILFTAITWMTVTFAQDDSAFKKLQSAVARIEQAKSVLLEAELSLTQDGAKANHTLSLSLLSRHSPESGQKWRAELRLRDLNSNTEQQWVLLPGIHYHATGDTKVVRCYQAPMDIERMAMLFIASTFPQGIGVNMFGYLPQRTGSTVLDGKECDAFSGDFGNFKIYFSKEHGLPLRVESRHQGASFRFHLKRVDFDTPIDSAAFVFVPPPGTRVFKEVTSPKQPALHFKEVQNVEMLFPLENKPSGNEDF